LFSPVFKILLRGGVLSKGWPAVVGVEAVFDLGGLAGNDGVVEVGKTSEVDLLG